jgi:hypothetical protein
MKRYRLWRWQRQYRKSMRYKKPRRYWVVVKVVAKRDYGYWRGCYKYNGYTFTEHPSQAYLFNSEGLAETTANNTELWRKTNYRVIRIKQ